jgi:ABC-type sugar transport system ATPase subunit
LQAVANLSYQVADGEFLVIAGPSGCGKTTSLRIVAGLEHPTSGSVQIDGQDVTGEPPARRRVAMELQDQPLFPHLQVTENLLFGLNGGDRAQAQARLPVVASELGIEGLLNRAPGELSGGECQRVALARALIRQRQVVLLDEPLSNVDRPRRLQIISVLKRLAAAHGAAVVYVTHEQSEALSLADRMIVMRAGRAEQIGTPEAVYWQPASRFVAEFLSATSIAFVRGRCTEGSDGRRFRAIECSLPLPPEVLDALGNQTVDLGIRPSAVLPSLDADPIGAAKLRMVVLETVNVPEGVLATLEQPAEAATPTRLRLFARFDRRTRPKKGDVLDVGLDASQFLWFDANTGLAVGRGV